MDKIGKEKAILGIIGNLSKDLSLHNILILADIQPTTYFSVLQKKIHVCAPDRVRGKGSSNIANSGLNLVRPLCWPILSSFLED